MLSALEIKIFCVRGQHTLSLLGGRQGRLEVLQVPVVSHLVVSTQRDPHRPLRERIVLPSDKTIYKLNLKGRKYTFDPCPYFSGLLSMMDLLQVTIGNSSGAREMGQSGKGLPEFHPCT